MILPILVPVVAVATSVYTKTAVFLVTLYKAIKSHLSLTAIKAEVAKAEAAVETDAKKVVAAIKAHL